MLRGARSTRANVQKENASRLTGLIPIDGENLDDAYDADKQIEQARAETEEARVKRIAAESEAYQFYVKCREDHGTYPPHGIYLDANPGPGEVPADGWRARYKPDRKTPWYEDVICQVCLWRFERMTPLPVVKTKKGRFTVAQRWLWRRPKDKQRLEIEGETRANELGAKSSNMERAAAQERSRAADLEVL